MPEHLSTRWRRDTDSTLHTGTNQVRFLSPLRLFLFFRHQLKNRLSLHCTSQRWLLLLCLKFGTQEIRENILLSVCRSSVSGVFRRRGCADTLCWSDHFQFSDVDSEQIQCGARCNTVVCFFFTVSWPSYFVYLSKQKCRSEGNKFEVVSVKPVPNIFKMFCFFILLLFFQVWGHKKIKNFSVWIQQYLHAHGIEICGEMVPYQPNTSAMEKVI